MASTTEISDARVQEEREQFYRNLLALGMSDTEARQQAFSATSGIDAERARIEQTPEGSCAPSLVLQRFSFTIGKAIDGEKIREVLRELVEHVREYRQHYQNAEIMFSVDDIADMLVMIGLSREIALHVASEAAPPSIDELHALMETRIA